jgi:hypothetical protein
VYNIVAILSMYKMEWDRLVRPCNNSYCWFEDERKFTTVDAQRCLSISNLTQVSVLDRTARCFEALNCDSEDR